MYKHGVYGGYEPSNEQIVTTPNTVPVYIGTAPVNRVIEGGNVNKPILISSIDEAKAKLGYAENDDFSKYTLSAVVFAHFKNRVKQVGPIIVINVLDPSVSKVEVPGASTSVVNKTITLGENVIASSINITDKVIDEDYTVGYDDITGRVVITFKTDETTVTLAYSNTSVNITSQEIIGSYDINTGATKGIYCIYTVYEQFNIIPNILCVPKYSKDITVRNKLLEVCKNISGLWDSIICTDFDTSINSYTEVIQNKKESNISSIDEKLCWPCGKMQGRIMYMSILTVLRIQQTDINNNGIPSETPSNKEIDISGLVDGTGRDIRLNTDIANQLNSNGITTGLFYGGKWVLWGPHMSNYDYKTTNKPEEMFDVNRRMDIYLNNDFKKRNAELVDKPMTRNDVDSILNTEQIRLNALISEGKLLYGKIEFRNQNNTVSDIMKGDFTFDTLTTATIPAKSLTQRVQYTSEGIKSILGGE